MRFKLLFDKVTTLRITVFNDGIEHEIDTIIDTGHTAADGTGLTLPENFKDIFQSTKEKEIKTAQGKKMCPFLPNLLITKVRDYKLRESMNIPTVITGDLPLLGVMFLQNCTLHLDGHKKEGYLELHPRW